MSAADTVRSDTAGLACLRDIIPAAELQLYLHTAAMDHLLRFRVDGGVKDLTRARWYISRLIDELEGDS